MGIIPLSIKLKATIKMEKARKIIRKAERDFLQARVKFINSFLDNNKQRDICRSQLVSIVTTTIMQQCQELIDKVREFRYLKIRERQINKFNRLLQKQKGNITYAGNPPTLNWGGLLAELSPPSQARVPVPIMAPQPQTTATTPC